jgi:hypothetical protein
LANIANRGLEESLLKVYNLASSLISYSDFFGTSATTGTGFDTGFGVSTGASFCLKTNACESELSLAATKGL